MVVFCCQVLPYYGLRHVQTVAGRHIRAVRMVAFMLFRLVILFTWAKIWKKKKSSIVQNTGMATFFTAMDDEMRAMRSLNKEQRCFNATVALKRAFKGVALDSLAVGEKSMVTKMNYVKGNFSDTHSHPHEQCGYVVSGEYRLKVRQPGASIDVLLHAGDSYAIPGGTPHSFEMLEEGEVVDVFTPLREDYL